MELSNHLTLIAFIFIQPFFSCFQNIIFRAQLAPPYLGVCEIILFRRELFSCLRVLCLKCSIEISPRIERAMVFIILTKFPAFFWPLCWNRPYLGFFFKAAEGTFQLFNVALFEANFSAIIGWICPLDLKIKFYSSFNFFISYSSFSILCNRSYSLCFLSLFKRLTKLAVSYSYEWCTLSEFILYRPL